MHYGKQLQEGAEKADIAREMLADILDSRLSQSYEALLEDETELLDDRDRAFHSAIDAEEWLPIVFRDAEEETLSTQEIQQHAYGLIQDIREVAHLHMLLPKLSGWGEPLHQVDENEFQYSPPPDWVTPEVDAILQYLHGAGWVTPEVIGYNLPDMRTDVDSIDAPKVVAECEELIEIDLVEESNGYYQITLNGEMCLDGRLDPTELGSP